MMGEKKTSEILKPLGFFCTLSPIFVEASVENWAPILKGNDDIGGSHPFSTGSTMRPWEDPKNFKPSTQWSLTS